MGPYKGNRDSLRRFLRGFTGLEFQEAEEILQECSAQDLEWAFRGMGVSLTCVLTELQTESAHLRRFETPALQEDCL